MPSDEELSQEEIDAKVYEVTRKQGPPPSVSGAASAGKSSGQATSAQPKSEALPARLARLESDMATLKKELQSLLLDLREKFLEDENPFNSPATPGNQPPPIRKRDSTGQ